MKLQYLLCFSLFWIGSKHFGQETDCYPSSYSGDGTYYEGIFGTSSGNCSLPVAMEDYKHCALNNFQYNNSNACGACVEVQGSKGSVILQVVDRCPECKSGDVDMTERAFAEIGNVIDGRIPISWKFVACPLNENIQIQFKEGSSQYWTAIQLRNLTHAVATLEYRDNDNWVTMERKLYNYFEEPNGIASPMQLRATSALGESLIFENINLQENAVIPTQKQFSTPQDCDGTVLSINDFEPFESPYSIHSKPGSITIYTANASFFDNKALQLLSISGQNVLAPLKTTPNQKQWTLDTSSLKNGIYILQLFNGQTPLSAVKIVLQ